MKMKALLLTVVLTVGSLNVFCKSNSNMETKENVTPQQVIENVHKAAEILKQQGEAGLKILSDPVSEFNTGDDYIFIIDVEKSLVPAEISVNIWTGIKTITESAFVKSPCRVAAG